MNTKALFAALLLLAVSPVAAAEPPAKSPAASAPPLKAELIAVQATYELAPALASEEFVKQAADRKRRTPLPKPPAVDLTLRLTNTTSTAQTITLGGDESQITLRLEGEGAFNLSPGLATTMEFRMGKPVVIPAGGTHEIPVKSLASGPRGIARYSYWTKPGEYQVHATFTTRLGKNPLVLKAEPLKVKITAPAR